MKIRPLHDRVIVKRLEEERKSAVGSSSRIPPPRSPRKAKSSIAAPARPTKRQADPDRREAGQQGAVRQVLGQEFKMDGQDYLHMREDDIIGIVE
jgi:chaperonin GroES